MRRRISIEVVLPFLLVVTAGCSVPKHTNTLIFGTNTKVALDVSQEPTGAYGFTLGYRRHEGVWMPLLANEKSSGTDTDLVPSNCKDDECRRFVGTTGAGGHSGAGAVDTYSVLATLSGQTSGGGSDGVKGGIAQVFATGFAARMLALTGGAALVNSNVEPTSSAAVAAIAKSELKIEKDRIDQVLACVQKTDGTLDATKYAAMVKGAATAEPKVFTAGRVAKLNSLKTGAQLKEYLSDTGDNMVPGMHAQVKTVCPTA